MATARPIPAYDYLSVEEYLHTSYRPDVDYIDGHVEERNLGEFDHADLQLELGHIFRLHANDWNVKAVTECRFQIAPTRFRIPDLLILEGARRRVDRIVREAPLLCIEILSPEDTWKRIEARIADYQSVGVHHNWVFDPASRKAYQYNGPEPSLVITPTIAIPTSPISINLTELFSVLD
ncbi:MAG: Uma2 family endonuclease [Acidobacteria bacterium]|nr:Uma2 family endonuclease [Acidobacteriota bacterium]